MVKREAAIESCCSLTTKNEKETVTPIHKHENKYESDLNARKNEL